MNAKLTLLAVLLAVAATTTMAQAPGPEVEDTTNAGKTIAEIATNTPSLSTLVSALQAAGLVEEASDPNVQLTVLAPSNGAFEAALKKNNVTAEEALADAELSNVLQYHIIPGVFTVSDFKDGTVLTALNGGQILVKNPRGLIRGVQFESATGDEAGIERGNIRAANGIIHIIDGILIPGPNAGFAFAPKTE